ncbi:MAG: glycosyltransferase [Nanoarchaeota archaeon]|nr:glycosyltransferase [Nanoarchaeota archaeon]
MVRVSVVMPNYNGSKYLKEAISSILEQSFADFELIIVDDCSSDDSLSVIDSFSDSRIKVFRNEKNLGVSGTLNHGLSHATGEYIARMDSDDISSKLRFEKQVKILDSGYDVVGSDIIFIDSSGKSLGSRKYSDDIGSVIRIKSPLAHPSVMFKKSLITSLGVYSYEFNSAEDYDLWLRFYNYGAKFSIIHEPLLKYRIHDNQVKSLMTKKSLRTTLLVKKHAKKQYRMRFGVRGEVRMILERMLLLIPTSLILWLFNLLERRRK